MKREIGIQPNSDLIDQVCEKDRLYFEEQPGVDEYVRPYVPGEFAPFWPEDAQIVKVIQVEPGVRIRQPLKIYGFFDMNLLKN